MDVLYGHWWNGKWGRIAKCDIWLNRRDGQLQVRWHGREWNDRDGRCPVPDGMTGLAVVEKLIRDEGGPEEDGGPWREIPLSLYRRSEQTADHR